MLVSIAEIAIFFILSFFFRDKNGGNQNFMSRDYTNSLRGVAILFIILQHTSSLRIFTPLGGIGVALFLLLSGYGLTESYQKTGLRNFWKKKVARIWIPYFLWINILLIIRNDFDKIFTIDYLLDILCLKTSFWFVGFLFWNYILFWMVFRMELLKQYHFIPFIIFNTCVFVLCRQIMAEQALSFYSGVCISLYIEKLCRFMAMKKHFIVLVISIFAVSILSLIVKQLPSIRIHEADNIYFHTINLICKYGFCLFVLFVFSIKNNRFYDFCSKISLELYLVHFSLLFLIKNDDVMYLFYFLTASFVGAWMLYLISNRIRIVAK
jgi:peptidoglycan/LPS O-acetylase OafA/YrhL